MGSNLTKDSKVSHLNQEEKHFVENAFRLLSKDKDYLKSEDLIDAWSYLVDPGFVQHVKNSCFHKSENAPIKIKPFAKHFYIVVKGSVTEKAFYIATNIFTYNPQGVTTTKLLVFVKCTLRSYFIMLDHNKPREYQSWVNEGVSLDQGDITIYSNFVMKDLIKLTRASVDQIERWLCHQPLFLQIWKKVLIYLYSHLNSIVLPKVASLKALPLCKATQQYGISILTIGKVMFINDTLPAQYRKQWTPLFNSKLHGESFSHLVAKITHRGPTILLMRDDSDHVFGGFAPYSWAVGPKFEGDSTASLFTLNPNMNHFIASGYNKNFQYLNTNQKTMPNGLGMGGQFDYWGLWLDDKFVMGQTSQSCSTFTGYTQMSSQNVFRLEHLEVWSVGEIRRSVEGKDGTILTRGEDKFFLELSGYSFRSDGLADQG